MTGAPALTRCRSYAEVRPCVGALPRPDTAALVHTANALAALRCYWRRTHRLGASDGTWLARRRNRGSGWLAADSPAALHALLRQQHGCLPSLARPALRVYPRRSASAQVPVPPLGLRPSALMAALYQGMAVRCLTLIRHDRTGRCGNYFLVHSERAR